MKDVVKKMIKGVVVEMLKADLATPIEELRLKIKDMLTDNIIDDYEQAQIDKIVEDLSNKADKNIHGLINTLRSRTKKLPDQRRPKELLLCLRIQPISWTESLLPALSILTN